MLVLSRKKNESIIIGEGLVKICVVEIRGDKVRLGIEAPSDVSVHRREVYEAIKRHDGDLIINRPTQPDTVSGLVGSEPEDCD